MRTQKMSLANIQGKLSRAEMKNIMAGDAPPAGVSCVCTDGYRSGITDCAHCFSVVCSTHGGISCTEGDCTTYGQ